MMKNPHRMCNKMQKRLFMKMSQNSMSQKKLQNSMSQKKQLQNNMFLVLLTGLLCSITIVHVIIYLLMCPFTLLLLFNSTPRKNWKRAAMRGPSPHKKVKMSTSSAPEATHGSCKSTRKVHQGVQAPIVTQITKGKKVTRSTSKEMPNPAGNTRSKRAK